jgi:U3 small nucleolar RNA-associated protein 14
MVIEEGVDERAGNEQHQADLPVIVEQDEHHIDDHQNNHLFGEADSKGEEETSDNEEGGENQLTPQEQLINYALTLDVEGTAALGFRPARSGQDAVILNV